MKSAERTLDMLFHVAQIPGRSVAWAPREICAMGPQHLLALCQSRLLFIRDNQPCLFFRATPPDITS